MRSSDAWHPDSPNADYNSTEYALVPSDVQSLEPECDHLHYPIAADGSSNRHLTKVEASLDEQQASATPSATHSGRIVVQVSTKQSVNGFWIWLLESRTLTLCIILQTQVKFLILTRKSSATMARFKIRAKSASATLSAMPTGIYVFRRTSTNLKC